LFFASEYPAMTRSDPAPEHRSGCPISMSLDTFGDRWSLLVIRDLMFTERRRFNEFLAAGEGIATNVLADRLRRLEAADLIARSADPEDGRKSVYRLTQKGMDLAPVLVEIVIWAARYEDTEAPPALVKRMHTDRAGFIAGLRARWRSGMAVTGRGELSGALPVVHSPEPRQPK
jgi:DNA-binding HxlR family transcriptional regulator